MHGHRVAEGDVLAQVVAVEDDARFVGEPFGGHPIGLLVDAGHAPPVAVTYLVDGLADGVLGPGVHGDADVVFAADDDVADGDALVAGGPHGRPVADEGVVNALVERVGHLPRSRRPSVSLPGGPVSQVGIAGVFGHRDRVAGVQAAVTAIPADRLAQAIAVPGPQRQGGVAPSALRIRHTSPRRCDQGRSPQRCSNMPPRAFTGASW